MIERELEEAERGRRRQEGASRQPVDCPTEWAQRVKRWFETTTLQPSTRRGIANNLLQVGRWLAATHPDVRTPEQWTRELAAAYVAAVDRATVGQWARAAYIPSDRVGQPLKAQAKHAQLGAIRTFFSDGQEWGWISRRFDPRRCFRTPRSVRSQLTTNPRVIADDVWAKLLWAGLNLTGDDLPMVYWRNGDKRQRNRKRLPLYPLEMVRAVTVVWLFAGLRSDEIRRLRVGCIRLQYEGLRVATGKAATKAAVCWLDVPVNKTGAAFTKPVDRVVGEAVEAWQAARPQQPFAVDLKTGEAVAYLFCYRGRQLGRAYLNNQLIPLLCRKAGVPATDARGPITSHRARSTVATQLFNAREPLSLFELQEWLGHCSPHTTQYYAKITPTKLARSYEQAGYFERNLRTIEVLIDQDAVKSGAATQGEPWRFYDLGHGYCTYDFFDQCPHRMACAKCTFYRPKGSSRAQLLEAKANLLRLKQEIPLTDDEAAAVDDGLGALERLCTHLADVPTPAGPTPRELAGGGSFVALSDLAPTVAMRQHPGG